MCLWLLSVITRDVPGDADGNQGNDDQNGFEHDYDDNDDNDASVTTRWCHDNDDGDTDDTDDDIGDNTDDNFDDISRSGAVVLVTGKQEAGINLGEILERSILFSWWSRWDYDNDDESWWQIVIDDDEIMTMMSIIW